MLIGLQNITLLAFILAVKSQRRNSVIYAHERAYRIAPAFGISPQTFNKYMRQLSDKGLIREHNGHRTIVSLRSAMPILLPDYHEDTRANSFNRCRFFRWERKLSTVKEYAQAIRFALAELNFKQQQHNISQNDILDAGLTDRFNSTQLRKYKALLKKHGANCLQQLSSTVRRIKGIVTGKHHLSRLLGCSASTALNMLRRWHSLKLISRQVIQAFIPCYVCNQSYDALKAEGYHYIRPNSMRSGFNVSIGSLIKLPARNK